MNKINIEFILEIIKFDIKNNFKRLDYKYNI